MKKALEVLGIWAVTYLVVGFILYGVLPARPWRVGVTTLVWWTVAGLWSWSVLRKVE